MAEATVQTFDPKWYQRLSPLARQTVNAWFASKGLAPRDVREARVTAGERGCVLVLVRRREDGQVEYDRQKEQIVTEERSFPDRPAAMR